MKIAFTYNCRHSDLEEEAEFDTPETVSAIATALVAGGHDVSLIEVRDENPMEVAARLRLEAPHIVINTVEGRHGRSREALYPLLFETLGLPYVGSDAHAMSVTLDKWLTKITVAAHGVRTPRSLLLRAGDLTSRGRLQALAGELRLPLFVKPNYEGSSKGIDSSSIVTALPQLAEVAERLLARFPEGILVEEFIRGRDVTVPFVEGLGTPADEGVLSPCAYEFAGASGSHDEIYDYNRKNCHSNHVTVRCPAPFPSAILAHLRAATRAAVRALAMRDLGRADFRVSDEGEILFLEMNALPSLEPGSSLFLATGELSLSYGDTLLHLIEHAAVRQPGGCLERGAAAKKAESLSGAM